jgi:hypothetical protein
VHQSLRHAADYSLLDACRLTAAYSCAQMLLPVAWTFLRWTGSFRWVLGAVNVGSTPSRLPVNSKEKKNENGCVACSVIPLMILRSTSIA